LASPLAGPLAAGIALSNVLPDFWSLLVTRKILGEMSVRGMTLGLLWADLWRSLGIAFLWFWPMLSVVDQVVDREVAPLEVYELLLLYAFAGILSTLFTSVWLWLYAASVLVSRALLRMNSGVGFLLRVTDVEKQPFRSMGFVSVIIVSCLFALGLPLVLL